MKKGISLVALVITIIVLIILTATVVVSIGGDNSIISKAKQAVENWNLKQRQEIGMVNTLEDSVLGKNVGTLKLNQRFFIVYKRGENYFTPAIDLWVYPTQAFNAWRNSGNDSSIVGVQSELNKLEKYTEKTTGGYLYTIDGMPIMGWGTINNQIKDDDGVYSICIDGEYNNSTRIGTTIENNGVIKAIYENGYIEIVGAIPCTSFESPNKLNKISDNLYAETLESGDFNGMGEYITNFSSTMWQPIIEE